MTLKTFYFFPISIFGKKTERIKTCHLSARQDVSGQLDLGEVALADSLEQPVVPHVGLLRLLRAAGTHAGAARPCADLLAPIAVRGVLWREAQVGATFDLDTSVDNLLTH